MKKGAVVRVLIADDSRTARAMLAGILDADPGVTVVAHAKNGAEAVELTKKEHPSLVLMDIEMPVMDGFEATKRIMIEQPTPIVVISARDDVHQVEVSMRAVRAGALTAVAKPTGTPGSPAFAQQSGHLLTLVKALADVKVVRQRAKADAAAVAADPRPRKRGAVHAVAVAASTGGPAALYRFLEMLPRSLDIPVFVVQHIADGFVDGLAHWLASATLLPVCVAQHGQVVRGGQVYIAPDDRHLEITKRRVRLTTAPAVGGFRPSATVLFASMADEFGPGGAGVVLTGMGNDGVEGARALRAAGGLVVAQDADTSVVFGMPRAVADAGLAHSVGTVEELALKIVQLASRENR